MSNLASLSVEEIFRLLESYNPDVVSEIQRLFHENLSETREGWLVSGLYEPHQPQGCPITQTNRGEEEQDNPEHQAGAGFSPRSCCEGDS